MTPMQIMATPTVVLGAVPLTKDFTLIPVRFHSTVTSFPGINWELIGNIA